MFVNLENIIICPWDIVYIHIKKRQKQYFDMQSFRLWVKGIIVSILWIRNEHEEKFEFYNIFIFMHHFAYFFRFLFSFFHFAHNIRNMCFNLEKTVFYVVKDDTKWSLNAILNKRYIEAVYFMVFEMLYYVSTLLQSMDIFLFCLKLTFRKICVGKMVCILVFGFCTAKHNTTD